MDNNIYRILDANYNRLKEGLRVCEEYFRFILNNKEQALEFKEIRHKVSQIINQEILSDLINARDVETDKIAYDYTEKEGTRCDSKDVLYANMQRAKEAVRVLEEYSKILNKNLGCDFQKLRFKLYKIEKNYT